MPAKYLRDVTFYINSPIDPVKERQSPYGSTSIFHRHLGLRNFIFQKLRREKHILEEGIRDVLIIMTNTPSIETVKYRTSETVGLYVDIDYDPNDLFSVEVKNEVMGPFFARLMREGMKKIDYPNFPISTVENAIQAYERAGFCYKFKAGERTIPGTKLKGAIFSELSCENLLRKLVISYRGKKMLERVIAIQDVIPAYYNHFPDFKLDGLTLHIRSEITDRNLAKVDLSKEHEIIEVMNKTKSLDARH